MDQATIPHTIETVESESTAESVKRECSCGWATIGTVPEPAHHTPLAQREQDHLDEVAKIADGTVWDEIPERHSYQLSLRRHPRSRTPNKVVIIAVWSGGSQGVLIWPWNDEGLAAAQEWCDERPTVWPDGSAIRPGSLAHYAE